MLKTKNRWDSSNKNLTEYLQIGDEVDEDLKEYFISVLPPITCTKKTIQISEPYDTKHGKFTYTTIEKINGKWIYTGHKICILEEEIDSSTKSKKGFGNCKDCRWHGDEEGCNVERGSKLCVLNKIR